MNERREDYRETAVLIAVSTPEVAEAKTMEYLNELAFLVETAGGQCVKMFTQNLAHPRGGRLCSGERHRHGGGG